MKFKKRKIDLKKKAQMKMLENVFVLIIFFFLLMIGIVFYVRFYSVSVQRQAEEFEDQDFIELGQKAPYVSEVQCPTYLEYENCLDLFKMEVFANLTSSSLEARIYYQEIFGFSKLTVHEIYPDNKSITFYDVKKGNSTSQRSIFIPISTYYPESQRRSFSILEIQKYS